MGKTKLLASEFTVSLNTSVVKLSAKLVVMTVVTLQNLQVVTGGVTSANKTSIDLFCHVSVDYSVTLWTVVTFVVSIALDLDRKKYHYCTYKGDFVTVFGKFVVKTISSLGHILNFSPSPQPPLLCLLRQSTSLSVAVDGGGHLAGWLAGQGTSHDGGKGQVWCDSVILPR